MQINTLTFYIQTIKFESTKIILSGRLYIRFIKKFVDNLNEIYVIPKIIIFTKNKSGFLKFTKLNENIVNHPFFNFGGIRTSITEIISFLKDEIAQDRVKKDNLIVLEALGGGLTWGSVLLKF